VCQEGSGRTGEGDPRPDAPSIEELTESLRRLEAALASRDERIAELERLLEESRRSGKRQAGPFSKGEPKENPATPGRKSGRRHGRHGHRAVPAQVDRELDAPAPETCECGGDLVEERIEECYEVDLPDSRPAVVTRFRVHVCRCQRCGKRVQGRHPSQSSDAIGAARSGVGPVAKSLALELHYGLGLSFEKVSRVLARFGIVITRGALARAALSTGKSLAPTHEAIKDAVVATRNVVMDETGWRIGGNGAWLWVATSRVATIYEVTHHRGFEDATLLVGDDYDGTLVRDGYVIYRHYELATHQSCLGHLIRRSDELVTDLPDWARGTPKRVKSLLKEALAARGLGKKRRSEALADIAERMELLCEEPQVHDENRRLVNHLRNEKDALFTFLTDPEVDATNWRAETGIRPAVVNRKVWGGNRTDNGAVTQGRVMSVFRTATQQGLDAVQLLVDFARDPTPGVVQLRL
jgi:transposase